MEWEKGSLFLQAAFIEIKSHKSLSMLAASRCMRPAAGGKKKLLVWEMVPAWGGGEVCRAKRKNSFIVFGAFSTSVGTAL